MRVHYRVKFRPLFPRGEPLIFKGDANFGKKNAAAGFSRENITLILPDLDAQPKGCGFIRSPGFGLFLP